MAVGLKYWQKNLGFLPFFISVYQGVEPHGTKKLAEQHVAEIVFKQLDLNNETPNKPVGPVVVDNSTKSKC